MNIEILPVLFVVLTTIVVGEDTTMHKVGYATTSATESICVPLTASNGQTLTVQGKVRSEPHDMAFDTRGCNETVSLTFAGDQDNDVSATRLRQDRE